MEFLIGSVIGLLIGIPLFLVRRCLFLRNMPDSARKAELIAEVLRMRQRGCGYAERLRFLRETGLRKDVADVLLGEAETVNSSK